MLMILCDSGPLIAAAASNDADHHACTQMFSGLRLAERRLPIPQTVVAEVGYMLAAWVNTEVEAKFLESVAAGDFEPVDLVPEDFVRMAELVRQYDDRPLGTTDASVIALAERLDVEEIATLDHRHFRVVRPSHVETLTLLPEVVS